MVQVTVSDFGCLSTGERVEKYTLSNNEIEVDVLTYGGIISSIRVPDRYGLVDDVVLGLDTLHDYATQNAPYFGAIVGRVANRICKASFELDGKLHTLTKNDGDNHLHGGIRGFDKACILKAGVQLSLTSPDGDEGYPGTVDVTVSYSLDNQKTLTISYAASTNASTLINLTSHSYFNLRGAGSGDVLNHTLSMFASTYTPTTNDLIPTGKIDSVHGTPFDFRQDKQIYTDMHNVPNGYDINYLLDGPLSDDTGLRTAAILFLSLEDETKSSPLCIPHTHLLELGRAPHSVKDLDSGRLLIVKTTGGSLPAMTGRDGKEYGPYHGLCLETQHPPDAVHHHPTFPPVVLRPDKPYHSTSTYTFTLNE
eukprot:gene3029-5812_t